MVIAGDFNLPKINWQVGLSSAPPSHCSHGFVDLLNDSFLYQHVDRPTRFRLGETPHTLDLVLSSEEAMVKNLEYLPGLGTSDHIMLQFQVACCCPPTEPLEPHLNLSKGNFTLLNQLLSEVEWPTGTIERRIRAHARAKGWAGLVYQRVYRLLWCGTVSFEGHVMT